MNTNEREMASGFYFSIKKFTLVGFLLTISLISRAQNYAEVIVWSEKKLTWADFKEEVTYDKYPYVLAKTRWRLVVQETPNTDSSDTIKLKIFAVIFPNHCWVRKKSRLVNDQLLAHEQLHFDIAELSARWLKQTLAKKTFTNKNYKKQLEKVKKRELNNLSTQQKNYDEESQHHNNAGKQEQWQVFVNKELLKIKDFASHDVEIVLK